MAHGSLWTEGKLDDVESPSELTINQTFCLYSSERQV
jgi:hypothetical protein